MGVLCFVFLICALRTDIASVLAFTSLVVAFGLLAGQHFQLAEGNTELAGGLQFVCSYLRPVP
jgi:succinate-acetate transporter protein